MIAVSKSELKAKMLAYFRRVEETGEDLVVTSHRKPVLRVTRLSAGRSVAELFGDARKRARLPLDAVLAPETEEWGDAV
ncbi:MAG: type II toxin-antitoxin system Phd/YefM family antitoxin [Kiritimatiellae bacterium]|nr:type II toxin-antitoxin system Phd/YefM family antitoxin [Kiritimatiellia bacterium]